MSYGYYVTASLFLAILSLLYLYYRKSLRFFEVNGIPCVKGLPLLGNYLDILLQRRHLVHILDDLYHDNADAKYVGFYFMTEPVLVIKDLEIIKDVSVKSFSSFSNHRPFGDEQIDTLFGGNILNLEGQKWKDLRSTLTPMFSSAKMKLMSGLMGEVAEQWVSYFDEFPDKRRMVDCENSFVRYTTDVITRCGYSIKTDSLRDLNNPFYVIGVKPSTVGLNVSLRLNMARVYPSLMKLLRLRIFDSATDEFFTDVVGKAVKERDETGMRSPDLLQLMIDARNEMKKGGNLRLDLMGMTSQAFAFFFAAFETPSAMMCVLSYLFAMHPDIQKRVQVEIDEMMDRTNEKPEYEDIQNLVYFEACYHEAIRLHGQVPFLDRVCQAPFELPPVRPGAKPFVVPKGQLIWLPVTAIHRDPKIYPNPYKYDPERFLGKKVTPSPTTLGFGAGPRACMGFRFAILETKVLMSRLMRKYNFVGNEKTHDPLIYSTANSFSVHAHEGFWLDFQPRTDRGVN